MLRALSAARRVPAAGHVRGLAKQAKAVEEAPPAAASGVPVVLGCNILKDGTDPEILPDSAYPDWLWTCHHRNPDYEVLVAKAEAEGTEALTQQESRLLLRGFASARGRRNNQAGKKK